MESWEISSSRERLEFRQPSVQSANFDTDNTHGPLSPNTKQCNWMTTTKKISTKKRGTNNFSQVWLQSWNRFRRIFGQTEQIERRRGKLAKTGPRWDNAPLWGCAARAAPFCCRQLCGWTGWRLRRVGPGRSTGPAALPRPRRRPSSSFLARTAALTTTSSFANTTTHSLWHSLVLDEEPGDVSAPPPSSSVRSLCI